MAREQAMLSFKVGGRIDRLLVRAGDRVQRGQLLAALDTRELDARARQAALGLEKAARDEARLRSLYARRAAMQQLFDDATTASRNAYQTSALARLEREHAVLRAPDSGVVARRLAEPNAVVGAGAPVLQLNILSSGYAVEAGLIDRDFVRVDAFAGLTFPGSVVELAEEPSALTGMFDVTIRLDVPPPRMVGGLVAKVEIRPRDPERVAIVPIESIVDGSERTASVYVVERDGSARRRALETAWLHGDKVAVRSGVVAGEQVVSEGAAFLRDGALVQVVNR